MHKFLFFYLLSSVFITSANNYTLTITEANHHLAKVSVVFSGVKTKAFTVKLPVWRTGKYEILNLSKNIRNFKALDAKGKELSWVKDTKNSWRIFVNTPNIVEVTYEIYANQLRDRVSHIDTSHAFLDASGVFVYSESQRNKPLTVKLNVPQDWLSVSGMESIGINEFKAENYDQLVDSPIESGIHHTGSLKVDQQTYEIIIWGDGNFNMSRLKKDIKKMHYQAKAIWKTFPFTRYVFMYHLGDKLRGATEHINSTIIQTDRLGFYPDEKYHKVIGTTAHEFVHTWNVKAYRPAGISPYDYSKENYSDLFWMAEGKTSYYDNLINVRAEIFTPNQYLEFLAEDINKFNNKPGRKVMSLAQSSFDTWMNNDENRKHNSTVSIYLKGSLVSLLLDKEIRELTKNSKSLDDLSLLLYQKYAKDTKGYSSYNVRQLLQQITGKDFNGFWANYVDGIKKIDFTGLLNFYGLEIITAEKKQEAMLSLGVKTKQNNGLTEISVVDTNGPAWHAGLSAGDTIIAIGNYQIQDNLNEHLENLKLGELYLIHYFNNGKLKQSNIQPVIAAPEKLQIVPVKSPTKQQKQHFKSWTKHDLSAITIEDKL